MSQRCPHCHQPMPTPVKAVRICHDCGRAITRHAKWAWVQRAGTLTCAHRHCDNPDSYNPRGEDPIAPAPLFEADA